MDLESDLEEEAKINLQGDFIFAFGGKGCGSR